MEPLFDPTMFYGGKTANFDNYYDQDYINRNAYIRIERGNGVDWYIRKGSMRVDSDYIVPTSGNIWNFSKMFAIRDYIRDGGKIILPSILGTVAKVSLTEIAEQYPQSEEDLNYDGYTRKFTTTIDELDEYIYANHENKIERKAEIEEDYPEFKQYLSLMKRGRKPKNVNLGDFNKTYAKIFNDFNHRVFGAILAGEPYIWIFVNERHSTVR